MKEQRGIADSAAKTSTTFDQLSWGHIFINLIAGGGAKGIVAEQFGRWVMPYFSKQMANAAE